jgi:uncharacterized membrane protein HdeD (DUF308 family)
MSTDQPNVSPGPAHVVLTSLVAEKRHELELLRHEWWWFLVLGIGLLTLGTISIGSSIAMYYLSLAIAVLFGVLLLVGGIAQVVAAFWAGRWSGFALSLLIGILYIVTGFVIIDKPEVAAETLTLVLAAAFIVSGLFRIIASMALRFTHWGWALLSGSISLVMGILIYKEWPASGLWVIGLFVGIEMIFNGWSWIMLALSLRALPKAAA